LMGSLSEHLGLQLPLAIGALVSCGFWLSTRLRHGRIAAALEQPPLPEPPPGAVAAERNVWATLAGVPAVRNGRIHFLSGSHLVVPGPRLIQGAEDFARVLHPELFTPGNGAPGR